MTAAPFDPNQPQPGYQQFQQPGMPPQGYPAPYPSADPKDHTAEFDPKDISNGKVFAMCAYLLGTIGCIMALLGAQKSEYAMFHVRQALKLSVTENLLTILSILLVWTVIVPIAGSICMVIIFVVRIILFFHVANGKAKDAPIIGSLGFLK